MSRRHFALLALLLLGLVAGCTDDPSLPPDGGSAAVRFEVRPSAILLGQLDDTAVLKVVAFDAEGREVEAPSAVFRATSDAVSVDAAGAVSRRAAAPGSAQIIVECESVGFSAIVFVLLAEPVPGSVLIDDEQVRSAPARVDGEDRRYTVALDGTYGVGTIVIARGGAPISGRVVSASDADGVVELEIVSPNELFEAVEIEETFDLSKVELVVDLQTAERFDIVTTEDGAYAAIGKSSGQGLRPAQTGPVGTSAAPPCAVQGQAQVSFSSFSSQLDHSLSFDLVYSSEVGVERMVAKGALAAKIEGTMALTGALEAKVECKLQFGAIPIPINGPLAAVFGLQIPLGIGASASVKTSGTLVSAKLTVTPTVSIAMGFECPGGGACAGVLDADGGFGKPTFDPTFPSGAQIELGVGAFAYADLSLGNAYLGIKLGGVKAGPTQSWNLRSEASQIDDEAYSSGYDLKLSLGAEMGASTTGPLGALNVTFLKIESKKELVIAESPKGTFESALDPNDMMMVRGRVELDPATLTYLGLEDVEAVTFYRYAGGALQTLATVEPSTVDQTVFEASWPFVVETDAGGDVFHAFVETSLSPLFSLEVKKAGVDPCEDAPRGDLRTQADVEAFAGTTVASSLSVVADVSSLAPLSALTRVCGVLTIRQTPNLVSLAGLENLERAGAVTVIDVPSLASVAALSRLEATTQLWIQGAPSLLSLAGLEGLMEVQNVQIRGVPADSVAPLANIPSNLARLELDMPAVTSLAELAHLTHVETLVLGGGIADVATVLDVGAVDSLNVRAPNAINFDALESVSGLIGLDLETATEVITLPALPDLQVLSIREGPRVVSVSSAPARTINIGSSTTIDTVVLDGLSQLEYFSVQRTTALPIVDVTGLTTATESFAVFDNTLVDEIAAGQLASAGFVRVSDNPQLDTLRLGGLETVTGGAIVGGFSVRNNDRLTTLDLSSLTSVVGDLQIVGNDQLADLDLSALETVEGALVIAGNPNLPIMKLQMMLKDVTAKSVDIRL